MYVMKVVVVDNGGTKNLEKNKNGKMFNADVMGRSKITKQMVYCMWWSRSREECEP